MALPRRAAAVRAFLLAVLIILCPPVLAADVAVQKMPDGSLVIVLSPEKVKACGEQGGCQIVSVEELTDFIRTIKPDLCKQTGI